jgi:predicted acetylornithine/succinylornithine family transaminase
MSKSQEIIEQHARYVLPTYLPSLVLVKGKGTKVWDADGKAYLDFATGISVVNLGHCHPKVVAAIQAQAARLVHVSNLYYNENQPKLAEKLSSLSMGGRCFFCNSGAEANEGMIKLARLWGSAEGRFEVISMKNSFHGRTLAALAATGQTKYQAGFEPLPAGFGYAEFNNLESVKKAVGPKTVAVLVEAVQGEGGVIPADAGFMKGLRALCDEKNLLMLCDEVQCGMARTGKWFGFQHYGVEPDAFSLAKSLGNGYPIGALVCSPKLADVFKPGNHASTFGGSPLACAAALATIQAIEDEGLVERAAKAGAVFRAELARFAEQYPRIKEVRGAGLMVGMVLDQPAKPLVNLMIENGLITIPTAESVVRFLPPLTVKDQEVGEALEIVGDALEQWHEPAPEAADAPEAPGDADGPPPTEPTA